MSEAIILSINTTESLDECPCRFENGTVEYYVTRSEVFQDQGALITLDRFTVRPDGEYEGSGSFSGTLSPGDGQDGEPMMVEGTFEVERIVPVG